MYHFNCHCLRLNDIYVCVYWLLYENTQTDNTFLKKLIENIENKIFFNSEIQAVANSLFSPMDLRVFYVLKSQINGVGTDFTCAFP